MQTRGYNMCKEWSANYIWSGCSQFGAGIHQSEQNTSRPEYAHHHVLLWVGFTMVLLFSLLFVSLCDTFTPTHLADLSTSTVWIRLHESDLHGWIANDYWERLKRKDLFWPRNTKNRHKSSRNLYLVLNWDYCFQPQCLCEMQRRWTGICMWGYPH